MGMNLPIVLYTHTDMKDIWPIVFGQIKKYLVDFKIYIAVNQDDESIPDEFIKIFYNDKEQYTTRWSEILPQIQEDVILFLHEDMILLGFPKVELLEIYKNLINDGRAYGIKLIFAGERKIPSYIHTTLVSNEFSILSIQPTIISKKVFSDILNETGPKNIWEFENSIKSWIGHFMVYLGTEKKRGIHHYDSEVFPYIATGINKGKWNYTEYKKELDILFEEYGVDKNVRGIV
jgi:hypothetical protein